MGFCVLEFKVCATFQILLVNFFDQISTFRYYLIVCITNHFYLLVADHHQPVRPRYIN